MDRLNQRKRIFANVGILVLAIVGVLAGALAFEHLSHGPMNKWASQILRSLLLFAGTIAAYSFLEWRIPAGPHKSVKAWFVNIQVVVLYLVTGVLAGALAALLAGALNQRFDLGWIDLRFAQGKGVVALMGAMLVFNFVFDFFYYWLHRFQHVSPILWQQHKLHHMDEQLNAITTARQHWLEEFFRIPVIAFPMAILFKLDKIDPFSLSLIGATVGTLLGTWAVFIHANLKLHLGFLSGWFAGPQVHRVHHSRLPQHRDRNFAAFFPLWDVLFGTYYSPARDEFPPTGVDGEKEFRTLGEAAILPFREWHRMFRARHGRKAVST